MTPITSDGTNIEIRSLDDVWRKWSRRFARHLIRQLELIIGLVSYHPYRLNRTMHWW